MWFLGWAALPCYLFGDCHVFTFPIHSSGQLQAEIGEDCQAAAARDVHERRHVGLGRPQAHVGRSESNVTRESWTHCSLVWNPKDGFHSLWIFVGWWFWLIFIHLSLYIYMWVYTYIHIHIRKNGSFIFVFCFGFVCCGPGTSTKSKFFGGDHDVFPGFQDWRVKLEASTGFAYPQTGDAVGGGKITEYQMFVFRATHGMCVWWYTLIWMLQHPPPSRATSQNNHRWSTYAPTATYPPLK